MRAASSRGTTHAQRALLGSAALGNSTATMAAGGNGSREGGPKHRDPRARGPSQAHHWPKGTNGYTWTGAKLTNTNELVGVFTISSAVIRDGASCSLEPQ